MIMLLLHNQMPFFLVDFCRLLCYDYFVATPIPAREGGESNGFIYSFYYFCRGKCSCLLHMQMVGQKWIIGNQP